MDKEAIAKMQTTLSGMKTKAEEVKAGAKDVEPSSTSQTILDTLTKKILGETGAVSSQQTGIEKMMSEAVASAQGIREAGAKRIGMEAEEGAVTIRERGEQRLTSAQERRGAVGFNPAALKKIQDDTTKQLADLDKRKDQALLENNTALADKISNLQLKAIDFQQKAEQQQFSNLMGMAGLGVDIEREERMESQFTQNLNLQKEQLERNKQSDMAAIALEWGETIREDDTLESLVNRIKPKADAKRRAELAKLVDENTQIDMTNQMDSFLWTAIQDGKTPFEAANDTIFELEDAGFKPTRADWFNAVQRAETYEMMMLQEQESTRKDYDLQVQANLLMATELFGGAQGQAVGGQTTPQTTSGRGMLGTILNELRLVPQRETQPTKTGDRKPDYKFEVAGEEGVFFDTAFGGYAI